jgi:hypothetical protein
LHDVIQAAALMPAGSWVMMHDVNLPALTRAARAAGHVVSHEPRFGPQYVFDFWSGKTIRAGNMAALKLPQQGGVSRLDERLRRIPAETSDNTARKIWRELDGLVKKLR